jgi:hypothetical protein
MSTKKVSTQRKTRAIKSPIIRDVKFQKMVTVLGLDGAEKIIDMFLADKSLKQIVRAAQPFIKRFRNTPQETNRVWASQVETVLNNLAKKGST